MDIPQYGCTDGFLGGRFMSEALARGLIINRVWVLVGSLGIIGWAISAVSRRSPAYTPLRLDDLF